MLKEKLKASAIHLLISTIVLSIFITIFLTIWYPEPYASVSSLQNVLLILVSVDLILGPTLTLIIYKRQKPSLKFDLTIIALIQLIALGYGTYSIYKSHPVYIVYAIDRFELVSAQEALPDRSKYEDFKITKLGKPILVYAQRPESSEERNKLLFETLSGLPDIERRPEYYEPFAKFIDTVFSKGRNIEDYKNKAEYKNKVENFLLKYGKTSNDYAFLPLVGKEKDVLWAWDRATKQPIDILDISPW